MNSMERRSVMDTNHKGSNLPPEEIKNIQDHRITLLEKNYERLSDKVEASHTKLMEAILGNREDIANVRIEVANVRIEVANVRTEMLGLIWKIPATAIGISICLRFLANVMDKGIHLF
nr:guanylate kinase [Candidatus Liberibacter asiaticus]MBA2918013.1 guanylate kinase [Candidatus Liberibacter asiaticus]